MQRAAAYYSLASFAACLVCDKHLRRLEHFIGVLHAMQHFQQRGRGIAASKPNSQRMPYKISTYLVRFTFCFEETGMPIGPPL